MFSSEVFKIRFSEVVMKHAGFQCVDFFNTCFLHYFVVVFDNTSESVHLMFAGDLKRILVAVMFPSICRAIFL